MRRVALLLLPEFSNLSVAAITEPLFVANWLAQRPLFEWHIVSGDGAAVRASNGRSLEVDGDLSLAAGCQSVFVLASFAHDAAPRTGVVRWLKRQARLGTELCGIENGSAVLAEAGLLEGHAAAVHWDNISGFQERYPTTRALAHLFARSGGRVSCAGAAAILDLMIAWIGWHADAALGAEVADHLLLGKTRSGDSGQRRGGEATAGDDDAAVVRAQALMREHIEAPLSCREIARRGGLSLRQIERRFRADLGRSVLQEYRQIRMAKAHQLLQQTALSVTDVAFACGFASPEYFSRLYHSVFHCSPSRDRRQSTTAPVLRQTSTRRKAG